MVSISEVLRLSGDYALAYTRARKPPIPPPSEDAVLISLSDKINLSEQAIESGKKFQKLNFKIYASEGTAKFYENACVKCEVVNKITKTSAPRS